MKYPGFWGKLPLICTALAPMADVTDLAFRRMVAIYGKPDVMYTEFVSAEGLISEGRKILIRGMQFDNSERPIVAQIFGSQPDTCARATELICALGFDGVEINMGCPDKSVIKQKAGAALIDNPALAIRIIKAMKAVAGDIPVSVKTRLGTTSDVLEEWFPYLISAEPAAITLHARTAKELSLVPARWERIERAAEIARGTNIRIIGNGDVTSLREGYKLAEENHASGFMVGRAAIGNPFFFSERHDVDICERLNAIHEHALLYEKLMPWEPFVNVRKHLSKYSSGFRGAKELRITLMKTNNSEDVEHALDKFR